jgi:hypothetical protein
MTASAQSKGSSVRAKAARLLKTLEAAMLKALGFAENEGRWETPQAHADPVTNPVELLDSTAKYPNEKPNTHQRVSI